MGFYKGKNILVTGGTGLIGRPLVDLLLKEEANVTIVSLDQPKDLSEKVTFKNIDLRNFQNCLDVCKGRDIVFNLVGVKGSPKMFGLRSHQKMIGLQVGPKEWENYRLRLMKYNISGIKYQ